MINIKSLIIILFPEYYKSKKFNKIKQATLKSIENKKGIEPELILLNKFINKGDYCFDIGANKGVYTYKFEQLTNSKNIYAFEPIPENYTFLKKMFTKCNIYSFALSDKTINSKFKIPITKKKILHTRGKLNFKIIEDNEINYKSINVKCITLDLFVKKENINRIDFLKIDVEGHELNVLKGAIKSIGKFHPIILIEVEQRVHSFKIKKIFDFIIDQGYSIKFYDLKKFKFKSINNFSTYKNQNYEKIQTTDYINNFFCIPN